MPLSTTITTHPDRLTEQPTSSDRPNTTLWLLVPLKPACAREIFDDTMVQCARRHRSRSCSAGAIAERISAANQHPQAPGTPSCLAPGQQLLRARRRGTNALVQYFTAARQLASCHEHAGWRTGAPRPGERPAAVVATATAAGCPPGGCAQRMFAAAAIWQMCSLTAPAR
jgi:hypothetical protein